MLQEGERSVIDLNVEVNTPLEPSRRKLWEAGDRKAALAEVRRIAGIRPLAELPRPQPAPIGIVERKGYRINKLVLETEAGIRLPALLFKPEKASGRRCLYLHGEGKHFDAQPSGPIEKLVQTGAVVLAVDLRGVGELGPTGDSLWGGNWFDFFTSYLLGRSMLGMRAEDVLACARYLSEMDSSGKPVRVDLVAVGVVGPPALHAAALESQLFDTVKLTRSLPSWSDLVRHPAAPGQLVNTVHGALRAYDLPDLLRVLLRDKVSVEDPLDLKTPPPPKGK